MIQGYLENVDVAITGLQRFGAKAKQFAFAGVIEGLKIAYSASIAMISAQDYSLEDLALMGHPYGLGGTMTARSGEEVDRAPIPLDPMEMIEVQSFGAGGRESGKAHGGSYLGALKVHKPIGLPGEIVEGSVDIDGDDEMKLLDQWLQDGTTRMIARPWMKWVVTNFGDEILEAMMLAIDAGMRLDFIDQVGEAP